MRTRAWKSVGCAVVVFLAALAVETLAAQQTVSLLPKDIPSPEKEQADVGIPVTSDLVLKKCGGCHRPDASNRMTRISFRRTTPEGWEHTIRRMVTLNGVKLEAKEAREILSYLATNHGLAPEEAKPGAFEVERRLIDYEYTADSSGNGQTGLFNAAPTLTASGRFGNALDQTGSFPVMHVNAPASGAWSLEPQKVSLTVWFKRNGWPGPLEIEFPNLPSIFDQPN